MNSNSPQARLFVPDALIAGVTIEPTKDQQHYLMTVMRLKAGAGVALFNGRDGEWFATLEATEKRTCSLMVQDQRRSQSNSPDLWLLFAPVKKARLDFIAQKASEMGASVIWPVRTDYCQVSRVNDSRLEANAIEAAEQTERLDIAEIRDFVPLHEALAMLDHDRLLIWCDEASADNPACNAIDIFASHPRPERAAIVIGPEGGFSEVERRHLNARENCLKVSLGPRILRADTAAIAALTCFQSVYGDWRETS